MTRQSIGVPTGVRSLVVFGGTFDPPHVGHVMLPRMARDAIGAEWLLCVPAARSPHKDGVPGASGAQRLEMVRLATQDEPLTSVSDIELARGENAASYTIDTLRQLRSVLGEDVSMRLLIGADQATAFHRWREPEAIIALAEPLVMLRAPDESRDELMRGMREHWPSAEVARWRERVLELPLVDVSATGIRAVLENEGPDAPALSGLIPGRVLEYIKKYRLYRPIPPR